VALLDGDDCYLPDHIASMRRRWMEFPRVDLMYCRFTMIGDPLLVDLLKRRFPAMDFTNLLGPIDQEGAYDWGHCMALLFFSPGLFLGNVTSTLSLRAHHAKRLGFADFPQCGGLFVRAFADNFILMSSALSGGRRVYVPDRTVGYRVHKNSAWGHQAMEHAPASRYGVCSQRFAIEDWLLNRVPRSAVRMARLLELELATAPDPSAGHRALYRKARREALRREKSARERWKSRLQTKLRGARTFFGKKSAVTLASCDPAAAWP
jgi:hypothetical protein